MDADADRATQRRDERAVRRRTTQEQRQIEQAEHAAAIEQQQLDQDEINLQAALSESVQAMAAVPLPDQPDVPLPPPRGLAGRLSDTVTVASRLPTEAWNWVRRRAAVAREDAIIRDGGDVPIDSEDDTQACIICTVNKRAMVLLPCGHCVICNACFDEWINTCTGSVPFRPIVCPICRTRCHHGLHITRRQLDALSAGIRTLHAGSRDFDLPAGPIFLNAQMPGAPILSMHSLLDGLSA